MVLPKNIVLIEEKYREELRRYLNEISRGNKSEWLISRLLLKLGHTYSEGAFAKTTGSPLTYFGIHGCSGCGADTEWYKSKYNKMCPQCNGTCWMHEVREDTYDVTAPAGILVFKIKYIAGKFDGHETGWHPKWWEVVDKNFKPQSK